MKYRIFDTFTLKISMVVLMVLDHIAQFIPNSPYWLHWPGRLVAPIFFYLLTEGYKHTSSRLNYMRRLFTWAGIMFIGNSVVFLVFKRELPLYNNILFSMALGIALLILLDKGKFKEGKDKLKNNLLIVLILFFATFAEGSLMSTAMVLIFHYLKEDRLKMSAAYLALSCTFLQGGFTYENLFILNPQWMMVFALPIILLYNGERGKNIKYFFYVFYPLHIWMLYIIGYFLEK